jgi:CreA protein
LKDNRAYLGRENKSMKQNILISILVGCAMIVSVSHAEEVGSVDTKFKMLGPDHKIVIEAFDDPKIEGITCYLSRSKKGGLKGMVGLAEETSDAALSCRQVGPIRMTGELKEGERVFSENRSLVFKKLQVVRFFDKKRQTYVYLAYSDRVIEGSPQNAISTVPIQPWASQ